MIVITGWGVVSAAGTTREQFCAALREGTSGIVPTAEPSGLAAGVGDFGVKQYADARALRRMARLSQMGLAAAKQALSQGMPELAYPRERCGIVLGTGLGTLDETMKFIIGCCQSDPAQASPLLFPSSVMNAAAGQIALELGFRGPNTTINHREYSPFGAFAAAIDLLRLQRADALLVGGLDELTEPARHGYRRHGGLTESVLRPYSHDRDGTVLGEGAAVFLLERADDAARRGARPLAGLASFASNGEERSLLGWRGRHEQAVEAIRQAIFSAGCTPEAIDYVAGAGNGLGLDTLEAKALAGVFGHRPVACSSIIGQTGEFMAAGALRIAAGLFALEQKWLPGTVGFSEPDPEAPIPGLVRASRPAPVKRVLIPSLAQGGANAALVLTSA